MILGTLMIPEITAGFLLKGETDKVIPLVLLAKSHDVWNINYLLKVLRNMEMLLSLVKNTCTLVWASV